LEKSLFLGLIKMQVYNFKDSAKKIVDTWTETLKKHSFSVSAPVLNDYNYEIKVTNGTEKLKLLAYFGKNGNKTVIQGEKESQLFSDINNILFEKISTERREDISEPEHYIGTDESGKGDYFGPLVVAGVIVNKVSSLLLKEMGVKDSKLLTDSVMKKMAPEIKRIVNDKFNIIVITPKTYNDLHSKMKNVNRILGWSHARVIENLLMIEDVKTAISDKFGDEKLIVNSLQEKGKKINLMQFTKAERYTAVAAASILARSRFNEWFEEQIMKNNLNLPKGASGIVDNKVKEIKAKYGSEYLADIAKLHFKTTNK
jgi:ribonuclease HIII